MFISDDISIIICRYLDIYDIINFKNICVENKNFIDNSSYIWNYFYNKNVVYPIIINNSYQTYIKGERLIQKRITKSNYQYISINSVKIIKIFLNYLDFYKKTNIFHDTIDFINEFAYKQYANSNYINKLNFNQILWHLSHLFDYKNNKEFIDVIIDFHKNIYKIDKLLVNNIMLKHLQYIISDYKKDPNFDIDDFFNRD